jgi:hypothetical protein
VQGTVHGASLTSDRFDDGSSAFNFDGVNDYISLPHFAGMDEVQVNGAVTIAWWQKVRAWDDSCCGGVFPVMDSGAYSWKVESGPTTIGMEIAYGTGIRCDSVVNPTGEWTHMAISFDDAINTGKVYRNGELVCTETVTGHLAQETGGISIGQGTSGADGWANGQIDEVRIYSRMLRDSEVYLLYTHQGVFSPPVDNDDSTAESGVLVLVLAVLLVLVVLILLVLVAMCCVGKIECKPRHPQDGAQTGQQQQQFELVSRDIHHPTAPPPPPPPSYSVVTTTLQEGVPLGYDDGDYGDDDFNDYYVKHSN